MAGTYTFGDLINSSMSSIPGVAQEKTVDIMCNRANAYVWNRFDWRETITELPPFWLVPDTQDYGAPAVIVPTDFQGIRKAFLQDIESYPERTYNLAPVRELDPTLVRSFPDAISFDKASNSFRLSRRAPASLTAPRYLVNGTYKILPTKMTKLNYQTTLLFTDDQYFDQWMAVMKYIAAPTGNAKMAAKQEADMLLHDMAVNEGLNLGDTPIAPAEALAVGTFAGTGLWGPYGW